MSRMSIIQDEDPGLRWEATGGLYRLGQGKSFGFSNRFGGSGNREPVADRVADVEKLFGKDQV